MSPRCAILFSLAVSIAACHPQPPPAQVSEDSVGDIAVHVVNRNRIDVMVYVSHDGTRSRLGLATASTTTNFVVSLRMLGAGHEYRLVGDPLGLRSLITTETLFGQPGDDVIWSLEDSFARSTVVVH